MKQKKKDATDAHKKLQQEYRLTLARIKRKVALEEKEDQAKLSRIAAKMNREDDTSGFDRKMEEYIKKTGEVTYKPIKKSDGTIVYKPDED